MYSVILPVAARDKLIYDVTPKSGWTFTVQLVTTPKVPGNSVSMVISRPVCIGSCREV